MNPSTPQRPDDASAAPRIATLDDMREHLQWALELEHATLPVYLCALYSLERERNPDAVRAVTGVFVEEMLHLALVANLLNAVGGRPELDTPRMLPRHPRRLPHGDPLLELSLLAFGPAALDQFLLLEQPAPPAALAQSDRYTTIGQFYAAIEDGLRELCARLGEDEVFRGDRTRQVRDCHFRYTAGRLVEVTDLATASAALEEIVDQGEGLLRGQVWDGDRDVHHPEREEVAHYYRFRELRAGRHYRRGDTPQSGPTGEPLRVDPGGIRPMRPNPRLDDHPPGSPIRAAQDEFNRTYCALLHQLEEAFDGSPRLFPVATGTMYRLRAQAEALMAMPDGAGTTAGPTFDYVPPELRGRPPSHGRRIVVLPDGPYLVHGGIALRRKTKIVSPEKQDALTWQTGPDLETEPTYALCRCGHSHTKPFCDGTHAHIGFDGTENAVVTPYRELRHVHDGIGISLGRVGELCVHAAFCVGATRPIAKMLDDTDDPDVRSDIMGRVDHCPSGSYTYALERGGETIEVDLPQAVSVLEEEECLAGPLWVTGGVPVLRADGEFLEIRNRTTLCRCGHSSTKPLCDGTHRTIGFREEPNPTHSPKGGQTS